MTTFQQAAAVSPEPAPYDIIVADDERTIAECIAEVLAEEGYRVRVVHDGASALLAITEQQPSLALLDITMPVMTGDEVLSAVQCRFPDVPVVLMSAGARLCDFLARGATDVLAKPFDIEQLLECINAHVRTPALQAQAVGGD